MLTPQGRAIGPLVRAYCVTYGYSATASMLSATLEAIAAEGAAARKPEPVSSTNKARKSK